MTGIGLSRKASTAERGKRRRSLILASSVMTSSVIPSRKYSSSLSPLKFSKYLGGSNGLQTDHSVSHLWLYGVSWACAAILFVVGWLLLRGRIGRAFRAIRDSDVAAASSGVSLPIYKTLAFGVSAGITGIAGGLGAIAVQFVAPDGYTILLAISLFLGMVVGGVGWLPGSIVGAAFIIFVPNIAEGISKGLSGAVFGVLLFLVIFLVPHGARQVAMIAQQLIEKLKK